MTERKRLEDIEEELEVLLQQGWTTDLLLLSLLRLEEENMTQLDDLMAAVQADQAATDAAVALLNTLNGQVADLQAQITALEGQTAPDLSAVTASVQAIADELTAAEQPPAPAQ